jgi:hypothetical protein
MKDAESIETEQTGEYRQTAGTLWEPGSAWDIKLTNEFDGAVISLEK